MFKELVYELTRGFAYRKIRHPEMRKYTVILPLTIYVFMAVVYFILPKPPIWLGDNGIVKGMLGITSILPGFYFAGLAAVATFGGKGMDNEMDNPAPQIDILVKGKKVSTNLTRRIFLSYLFSYLVIASFILCFSLLAINFLEENIVFWKNFVTSYNHGEAAWNIIAFTVRSAIALVFSTIVVTTLHGIFFLTERMHRP